MAPLQGAGACLGKPDARDLLEIRIDTREQTPLSFDSEYVKTVRDTVSVFDYALNGDQDNYAVERKSLNDFVQAVVLSKSWKRELAKIEKAQGWLLPIVYVLEFNRLDISKYDYAQFSSGRVHSQFVYRRVAELIYQFNIHLDFCGSREMAAYSICTLLKRRKESLRVKK